MWSGPRRWMARGTQGDVYYVPETNGVLKLVSGGHEVEINRVLSEQLVLRPNPHFIPMLHHFRIGEETAMCFPYVEGETLREWIEWGEAEEVEQRLPLVLLEIVGAMAAIQSEEFRYAHGDLHAENVVVGDRAVIIDQGLASVRYGGRTLEPAHHGGGTPAADLFKLFSSVYKKVQRRWENRGELFPAVSMLRYLLNGLFSPYSDPGFCGVCVHHDTNNTTFLLDLYLLELGEYAPHDRSGVEGACERLTYEFAYRMILDYQTEI